MGTAALGLLPIGTAFADDVSVTAQSVLPVDISTLIANNQVEAGVIAGAGILVLTLVAAALQSQAGRIKGLTTSALVATLENTRKTLIVDIRSKASVARDGAPNWARYGKRSIALPYFVSGKQGTSPDPRFGEKFAGLRSVKQGTVVILVDSNGNQAPAAAKQILKLSDVKPLLYLKGGVAEWKASGMAWKAPFKFPGISLPDLSDTYKKNPGIYNAVLAVGAAAASIAVVFSELDIFLEVVGLAAAAQLLSQKLLFAEDRSETIKKFREIRDEKIALDEAGDDLKRLAGTIFDFKSASKAKKAASKPDAETKSTVTPVTSSSIIQGVGSGASAVASNQ